MRYRPHGAPERVARSRASATACSPMIWRGIGQEDRADRLQHAGLLSKGFQMAAVSRGRVVCIGLEPGQRHGQQRAQATQLRDQVESVPNAPLRCDRPCSQVDARSKAAFRATGEQSVACTSALLLQAVAGTAGALGLTPRSRPGTLAPPEQRFRIDSMAGTQGRRTTV
jgi:hypothetical protein